MHAAVEYAHRRGRIRHALSDGHASQIHTVILQFTSVNLIDSSGLSTLRKLFNEMKSGALDGPPQESHTVEGTMSRSMHNLAETVAKPVGEGGPSQPLPDFCKGMAVVLVGCTGTVRDTLYAADLATRTKAVLTPLSVATVAAHWHTSTSSGARPSETALSPAVSAGDTMGSPNASPRLNDQHEYEQRPPISPEDGEKGETENSREDFEADFGENK